MTQACVAVDVQVGMHNALKGWPAEVIDLLSSVRAKLSTVVILVGVSLHVCRTIAYTSFVRQTVTTSCAGHPSRTSVSHLQTQHRYPVRASDRQRQHRHTNVSFAEASVLTATCIRVSCCVRCCRVAYKWQEHQGYAPVQSYVSAAAATAW